MPLHAGLLYVLIDADISIIAVAASNVHRFVKVLFGVESPLHELELVLLLLDEEVEGSYILRVPRRSVNVYTSIQRYPQSNADIHDE